MAAPSNSPYDDLRPTPFAPAYEGVIARPSRQPNFTSYGIVADPARFTDAPNGGVHTVMSPKKGQRSGQEILAGIQKRHDSTVHTSPSKSSQQTPFTDSSSEAEIYPSSGVPLTDTNKAMSFAERRQAKTFQQLEAENGIMQWNMKVLDHRWVTPPPGEMSFSGSETIDTRRRSATQEAISKAQEFKRTQRSCFPGIIGDLFAYEAKMHLGQIPLRTDPCPGDRNYPSTAKAEAEAEHSLSKQWV